VGKRACPAKLVAKGFIKTTEKCNDKKILKRTMEIMDEDIKEILIRISTKCCGDTNKMEQKDINKKDEDKLNSKTKDKTKSIDAFFESFWEPAIPPVI
jgi:hypothetical protein